MMKCKKYTYECNSAAICPCLLYEPCDSLSYLTENIDDIIDGLQEKIDCKLKENEKRESDSVMFAKQFISD